MNIEDRQKLQAEQVFLRRLLVGTPAKARLTRMSTEARIRNIEAQLTASPIDERVPARAKLTFDGVPVVGSHGVFADFGMRAVSSFTDAVACIAASLTAPLSAMGPIPNRDQNQLLITNTAIGSFGFELEEFRVQQSALTEASPVAVALDRTQALLQSTLGNDEDLADIASETDPRALEKVRAFLKVLADSSAVCTLQFEGRGVRFTDVGQVRNSLARLESENLKETSASLQGEFVGALPKSRTFEFQLTDGRQIIRGKAAPSIQDVDVLNEHRYQQVRIEVMVTQVGNGRPRYLLTQLPQW